VNPPPSTPALDVALQRFDELLKSASLHADRTHRVADRALGSRPEADAKAPRPPGVGIVGVLQDKLDDLEAVLGSLATAVDRLDRFV
jgi:hypothetical protein